MSFLLIIVTLVIILFVINAITGWSDSIVSSRKERLPYTRREYFFDTVSESTLFKLLDEFFGKDYHIFSHVNLDKIIYTDGRNSYKNPYYNKIDRKSVDFLLLHRITLLPVCAIELDGTAHNKPGVKERDKFKNQIFEQIGIPLFRIKVGSDFKDELQRIIPKITLMKGF